MERGERRVKRKLVGGVVCLELSPSPMQLRLIEAELKGMAVLGVSHGSIFDISTSGYISEA